jgi:hypothetical protein
MSRRPLRRRLAHLPSGLVASGVLLVVGTVLGALLRGWSGALGAALGVILVAASYTASSMAIAWADSIDPRLVLPAGLMTYLLKIVLFAALLAGLAGAHWRGLAPAGIGIMATALTWTVVQAVWTWRARIPYVDVELPHQTSVTRT